MISLWCAPCASIAGAQTLPFRLIESIWDSRFVLAVLIQAAGWGWRPAADGQSLIRTILRERVAAVGSGGSLGAGDGGAVRGERGERGEVVAAAARDGERGVAADGRAPQPRAPGGERALAAGAAGGAAGPDVAGAGGRAGASAAIKVEPRHGVALLRAEGLQLQKKRCSPVEQLRPAIARRREQWKKYQGRLDPRRLVFIDETWAKTNMTPTRGWAPRGQRAASPRRRSAAGAR